jgi:hypothetical protein
LLNLLGSIAPDLSRSVRMASPLDASRQTLGSRRFCIVAGPTARLKSGANAANKQLRARRAEIFALPHASAPGDISCVLCALLRLFLFVIGLAAKFH